MSDINIRIGGDNSDYLRVLNQSEVSSAEFHKRVAAQTAAVIGAESRLAELRGRHDTLRASGYNQDIFLQREILSLKAEIATMEEGSLAQTEKKIILEGKLIQLGQVIAGIKTEDNRATKAQTAGLDEATTKTVGLKEAFKSMGVTIKGAGIGVAFGLLISGAREAIAQATALRDKLRETGQPIDSATRSLASFGDGLKGLKQFGIDAVGFLVGGFTQLGDVIGSTINRIRGISEAQENQIAAIADETERSLARIAAARKKFEEENTPEKQAEREKKYFEDRARNLREYLENKARLEQEAADRAKRADENALRVEQEYWDYVQKESENALRIEQEIHDKRIKDRDENREKLLLEAKQVSGLTEEEGKRLKVLQLQTKQKDINREIDAILLKGSANLTAEDRTRLGALTSQLKTIDSQIVAVQAVNKEMEKTTPIIESNIAAWEKFKVAITTTGRGDRELTDRELERKIANIQQDIFRRRTNSNLASASLVGGISGYDPLLGAQQSNLQQTLAELNLRRNVRQRAGALGEDAAFSQFSGLTEQRFQQILQGFDNSTAGRVATALERLNVQLKQGFPTVIFTGTS